MGEGSSRSAGDPPGVTVTASMSAQSLVAQGCARPSAAHAQPTRARAARARRPARPRRRRAPAARRGRRRGARRPPPTRTRAASRSTSQNTGSGSSEPSGATPPIANPVCSRTRAASARVMRPPASAASRASSRRLSPATSASTGRLVAQEHERLDDLADARARRRPLPRRRCAPSRASRRSRSRGPRHARRCARARASCGVAGVLIAPHSRPRRRLRCASGVAPARGSASGAFGREHRLERGHDASGRTACPRSGAARAAPPRVAARPARTGAPASSPRTCRRRPRCAPRSGSRTRPGRRDSRCRRSCSWWWRIAGPAACSAGMRSTMRSPSSGCRRMIAHSSSSSVVGLSSTRSGTESLPMSCSQPPSSQRSAVRESRCSARAMRAASEAT